MFVYLNLIHVHDQATQNYGNGISAISGDMNNNHISNNMVANIIGNNVPNDSNYLGLGFTHTGIPGQQDQITINSEASLDPSMPSIEDYRRALQSRTSATTNYTGRAGRSRGQSSRRGNKKSAKNHPINYNNNKINNHDDANRRCSNHECGISVTPMWRKGPLGPKVHSFTFLHYFCLNNII